MAAPAATSQRIDIGLKSLELMLGDLTEVSQQWGSLSDGERASWSLDWDQLAGGYLPLLERCRRTGKLSPIQAEQYRGLRRTLQEFLPFIRRLGLYPPPSTLGE